jgi:leucyl-tRNA synthetase
VPVWWCEDLKTVLANEEVINGRSERGNHPCERRPLKQWVLKITAYADRLLRDLDGLDWPENVKKMQVDWIGRSEGAEIDFPVIDSARRIRVFSTRPDTLFGVTALVLAPEHESARELVRDDQRKACETYISQTAAKSERDRKAETGAISGVFTGAFAQHPLRPEQRVPIYLADYVIADYGTGAVMSVPAHDERDFAFAKAMALPIRGVIRPRDGSPLDHDQVCLTDPGLVYNSPGFDGLESSVAIQKITAALAQQGLGQAKISYKLRDWVFSRQRYWGEPFPLFLDENGTVVPARAEDLPITLPDMVDFKPSEDGSAPLARAKEWVEFVRDGKKLSRVTDTMPGWAGSCWYYLRFMDPLNSKEPFSRRAAEYWGAVDLYVGGVSHAVMHLLYARFWHKVFYDCGLVPHPEPFKKLFNQGMVTAFAFRDPSGRLVPVDEVERRHDTWVRKSSGEKLESMITKMAKSLKNVVTPDEVINNSGCDVLRLYEMFMGPLDTEKPWTHEGIAGCERFIRRLWNLFHHEDGGVKDQFAKSPGWNPADQRQLNVERALNRCLKRVDDSFANFNFNTAVAAFMEFLNDISPDKDVMARDQAERFLRALSPFCPHVAAELWERIGHSQPIDYRPWPTADSRYLTQTTFELVISINGKVRKKMAADKGLDEKSLEALALREAADLTAGKAIAKVIVVRDKLVNIVLAREN